MPGPIATLIGRFIPLSFLSSRIYDNLAEVPKELSKTPPPPSSPWIKSRKNGSGRRLPQSIAHRGYKASFPENTMVAFRSAVVDAGADGLETDIHLTRDGVVVLSHDATLERCFGHQERIVDVDYSYVKTLRTKRTPPEAMPRLDELLEFLAEPKPGREKIWLLLDIKMDNDSETVMRRLAETIASVKPHPHAPWTKRIVMGVWAYKYVPLCYRFVPDFPVTYIGFSTDYARRFLAPEHANINFNMLTQSLYLDPSFIATAHDAHRSVLAWTVNSPDWMRWCLQANVDAVITDDPARFNKEKEQWMLGHTEFDLRWQTRLQTVWLRMLIFFMNSMLKWRASKQERR